jgi:CRISPR-associated protein Csm1
VVYAAGGNFMLLAPRTAEDDVDEVRREINQNLLEAFGGDLYLCLAAQPLEGDLIGSAAFARKASRAVKQAIAGQKRQRFREETQEDWELLFEPKGKGGDRYCAVCQRELGEGEGTPIEEEFIPPQGPSLKCDHCAQFERLAEDIAYEDLLLAVGLQPPQETDKDWQKSLHRLTGVSYAFEQPRGAERLPSAASIYAINDPNFLDVGADGFLFLGNTTPREKYTIRTFGEMADDAAGVKRVGVLRMDVDDLGRVMIEGLDRRTMALTSALSSTLELFFSGWLNKVCEKIQESKELLPATFKRQSKHMLYIIYSGGDDLFIVGTWDRLPLLAERVHNDFAAFTGHNPHLHISAGLTLERRKFPLYRAAEQALDALDDGAKAYVRPDGGRKDAVTFLDQTVAWDDFAPSEKGRFGVKEGTRRLVDLVGQGVPRSLLQMVQSIYGQYLRDIERNRARRPSCEPPDEQLYYGRWMWMQAYQIQRLTEREKDKGVKRNIRQLQEDLMCRERVYYSGLAARWAEYLTRKERQDGE